MASIGQMPCHARTSDAHSALRTVRHLRSGLSLERFCELYKLNARHHPKHPKLVQLSYDMRDSDLANAVVQECRGLILEKDSWRVVSMPFSKFFNADESMAKATRESFDWSTARVHEKLDGSLVSLYWYGGGWSVASMKLPAADGEVPGNCGGTFASVFWSAFAASGYELPTDAAALKCCYMFELCLPGHTIVVRHVKFSLTLIGARDISTLGELDIESVGAARGWKTPPVLPSPQTLEMVRQSARGLNPVEHEGFVAVDAAFRRLKIKSPSYVALHHIGDVGLGADMTTSGSKAASKPRKPLSEEQRRLQRRRLLEVARCLEGDEFLAYFPSLRGAYEEAALQLGSLRAHLQRVAQQQAGRTSPTVGDSALSLLARKAATVIREAEDMAGSHAGGRLTQKTAKMAAGKVAHETICEARIADVECALKELAAGRKSAGGSEPREVKMQETEDETENETEDETEDETEEEEVDDETAETLTPAHCAGRFAALMLDEEL